jgi:hypothetical protein
MHRRLKLNLLGVHKPFNIKHRRLAYLRNLNETIATITARAGASGGVGGSAGALLRNVSGQGGAEYATSIDNATLALAGAQTQAAIYRYSGKVAKISSQIQMVGTAFCWHRKSYDVGGWRYRPRAKSRPNSTATKQFPKVCVSIIEQEVRHGDFTKVSKGWRSIAANARIGSVWLS